MPTKKRNYRKKQKIPRSIKWKPTNTLQVAMHELTGVTIANDTTAETRGALTFKLSECNYFTRFTAIYDQYRIDKVIVTFRPAMGQVVNKPYDDTTTGVLANACPRFVTAIDFDDNSTPSSLDELMSRSGSRTTLATKQQVRAFKPKRLIQVFRTLTTTGYMPDATNRFLDCAQTDIPHYGLKYALDTCSPIRAYIYEVDVKYHITFKGLRH